MALIPLNQQLPSTESTGPVDLPDDNPAIAYLLSLNSKRSRQTMFSFLTTVARLFGFADIKTCEWSLLRRFHVQAVIEMLNDAGKAPATINTYLSALKGVAYEAWTLKVIDTESYQHIKHVRSVKGSRLPPGRALTRHEIAELLGHCQADDSAKGIRDSGIFALLLGCGLRRSEIVALDIDHIDFSDNSLKILGKGNKERLAFVPDSAWKRLMCWISLVRGKTPGPLFYRIRRHNDITQERLTDQAIYYLLETRCTAAGIDKCSPHDLRRTYASMLLDNGEDLITVKDAMGHESIMTTQKYDRRGNERLKKAERKSVV